MTIICPFSREECVTNCRMWLGDGCAFELNALYLYDIGKQMRNLEKKEKIPLLDAVGLRR